MRFAAAHKTATYMMVGFAYLAMVTGGSLSSLVEIGGAIGLAGSWWWEPPLVRYERWTWLWTLASVFALVYSVLTAIVTGDFLGVGGQFLIWLVVAKAYNRRAARDWQQMYLLAFLMLVAGSVLNPDLTYGVCFLGFVIASTWALTLFHLRREMEDNLLVKHAVDRASERVEVRRILDSKRIVGGRFFLGTGLLSLCVFGASAILFLAMPRVGMGFFLKTRNGLSFAGFNDGTKLGGHGVIKNDSTVVMRVELPAEYGNREAPYIHWRGASFDAYTKGQWSRWGKDNRNATRETVDDRRRGYERHYLLWDHEAIPADEIDGVEHETVRQEVWLEPFDTAVLFGASRPRVFELARPLRPRRPPFQQNDEVRFDHPNTIHYTVWSDLHAPAPEELRAARGALSIDVTPFLDWPRDEITLRTQRKALEITRGLTNNFDKARAIQAWLNANLTYTLELEDPGGREPIDFFLFDRKKGHCEYFASAFAILARINGIPTRTVNGFLGGEWNEYKGYIAVRAGDAHSWDEVYFPGHGWVTFDPTPASDELGRGGTGWRARLGRFVDTLRFQWTKWVIEYDLASQLALFKNIGSGIKSAVLWIRDELAELVPYWPIGAAIAGGFVIVVVLRRRRRRAAGVEHVPRSRRRVRSAIALAYDHAAKALAKFGVPREPATTPRELATRLTARGHAAAARFADLVALYYAAEWGGRSDPADEARANILAGEIRDILVAHKRNKAA